MTFKKYEKLNLAQTLAVAEDDNKSFILANFALCP